MSKDIQPNTGGLKNASDIEVLREVAEGRFVFRASLPVSARSRYGGDLWTWYDPSNPRLAQYSESQLTIDWADLLTRLDLSPEIVEDLKKYAFLRYAHSKVVFPQTKKNAHPQSVATDVKTLANFLSHVRRHVFDDTLVWIDSTFEIELDDLKEALTTYPMKATSRLKVSLQHLASGAFRKYLDGNRLRWNAHDIETIDWNIKKREHYQRLPEEAFRLLSNAATADVKQFLTAIGVEPQDTTEIGRGENLYLSAFGNFGEFFNQYVNFRVALKQENSLAVRSKYAVWVQSKGNAVRKLSKLVERARMAGQVLVTMYTGARMSELKSFRSDCLRRKGDAWVIVGTHLKHEDIHAPVDQDEWVAIPIVRDAVRVLQEVGRAASSTYLFHGSRVHGREKPMTSEHLSKHRLTPYLSLIDTEGRWRHLRPHAHRFRNSIVFEMRKAGLGIPFITFQLKHLFNELEGSVNNTTLIYGGIGSEATRSIVEEANLEAIREIYHPDSPVAGGGAEEHRRRRAAYFQGMVERGVEADDVLRLLAVEGMWPMTDVGMAYCRGKKKIEVDGTPEDPPCIGSLRCNPVVCKQGIITVSKLPLFKTSSAANRRRAQDPAFAYAKPVLEAAADEQDATVRYLEEQISRKNNG